MVITDAPQAPGAQGTGASASHRLGRGVILQHTPIAPTSDILQKAILGVLMVFRIVSHHMYNIDR